MPDDSGESEIEIVDRFIDQFETAMLSTRSLQGDLRARPMMIAGHEPGGVILFVSGAGDEKLKEILETPAVVVTMQSEGQYLSISGSAVLDTDQVKLDQLWAPSWRLWFPAGSGDPDLVLIRIEPSAAEYWDRTGANRLEFLWRAGKALLQREKTRDDELSGHAKVDLGDDSPLK
jgi:general stress protein 26